MHRIIPVALATALLVPITGWSETWITVPAGSAHQVDTDSIVKSGAFVLAWVRSVYPTPLEYAGKWAYSEKAHIAYDCAKQSRTLLATHTFEDPDSTVLLNTVTGNPTPASYQRPDPVEKVMQSFVCRAVGRR